MVTARDVKDRIGICGEGRYHPGYDCSEIAESLLDAFPEGRILRIRGMGGSWVAVQEYGCRTEPMEYHDVFVLDGTVFDPRWAAGECGLPYNEYVRQLAANNPGGMDLAWR